MPLTTASPVAFIPTRQPELALAFYQGTLGLRFEGEEPFALVFRVGAEVDAAPRAEPAAEPDTRQGTVLRVVKMPEPFTPAPFTVFGWEVAHIEEIVDELVSKGVTFLRYGFLEQDDRAIWHASGRVKLAWFQDPEGNTLSLSQHSS